MNKKNLLVVGGHSSLSGGLHEWTKLAHPYHISQVANEEEAIEFCHLQHFDMVLVDSTDSGIDSKKLQAVLPILQDNMVIFQYEGESSDKLSEFIEGIFHAQKYRRILNMILPENNDQKGELPQFSLN